MPLPRDSQAESQSLLPVAEIFGFERVEVVGAEIIATVRVGDDQHPPHLHGLRAPKARWLEMLRAIAEAEPGRAWAAERETLRDEPAAAPAELPPHRDPENAFFRRH